MTSPPNTKLIEEAFTREAANIGRDWHKGVIEEYERTGVVPGADGPFGEMHAAACVMHEANRAAGVPSMKPLPDCIGWWCCRPDGCGFYSVHVTSNEAGELSASPIVGPVGKVADILPVTEWHGPYNSPDEARKALEIGAVAISPTLTGHVTFAPGELEALTAGDPVLEFAERVNDAAIKDPCWHQNFRLAICKALSEEHRKYLQEKVRIQRARDEEERAAALARLGELSEEMTESGRRDFRRDAAAVGYYYPCTGRNKIP